MGITLPNWGGCSLPEGDVGTFSPLTLNGRMMTDEDSLPGLLITVRMFTYVTDGDTMVPGEFDDFR